MQRAGRGGGEVVERWRRGGGEGSGVGETVDVVVARREGDSWDGAAAVLGMGGKETRTKRWRPARRPRYL